MNNFSTPQPTKSSQFTSNTDPKSTSSLKSSTFSKNIFSNVFNEISHFSPGKILQKFEKEVETKNKNQEISDDIPNQPESEIMKKEDLSIDDLIAERKIMKEEVSRYINTITNLSNDFDILEKKFKDLNNENKNLNNEIILLKEDNEQYKAKNSSLTSRYENIKNSVVFENVEQTQNEKKSLQEQIKLFEQDIIKLKENLNDKEEEIKNKNKDYKTLIHSFDDLQNKFKIINDKYNVSNENINNLTKYKENLLKEIEMLKEDYQKNILNCKSKEENLSSEVNELTTQRNNYKNKCTSLSKDLERMMKVHYDKHQNELIKLKQENDMLYSELKRKNQSLNEALEALDMNVVK